MKKQNVNYSLKILIQILICVHCLRAAEARAWSARNPNVKLLNTIKSYMNQQADPCEDFYQYACGNWQLVHGNDLDKYMDTIGKLEYQTNEKIKNVLERAISTNKPEYNEIYRKVRLYYEMCKQEETLDPNEYLKFIKPSASESIWPGFDSNWDKSHADWCIWSALGQLQLLGFNGYIFKITLQNQNATHLYINLNKLDQLGLTAYEQTLLDALEGSYDEQAYTLAENLQKFMEQLAVLYSSHNEKFSVEMKLLDLEKKLKKSNFRNYFKEFLDAQAIDELHLEVGNLDYFRKLQTLLERTPKNILIHFIKLKLLGYLEKEMPLHTSAIKCIQHIREFVPLAMDYIFEQEIYRLARPSMDPVIQRVFQKMQQQFVQIISEHQKDFQETEIKFLMEKIKYMKLNIGNLPQTADVNFYYRYFESWHVGRKSFYKNHLNILKHFYTEKYRILYQNQHSAHHTFLNWQYGSPAYQPLNNLLIIPHSYLQFPIFHPQFHELFLYAELGNTLGHEMVHAFDLNGLQYDAWGNPSNVMMSSIYNKEHMMTSLQCLSSYKPSNLNEEIADFSGFRLAYESFFHQQRIPKFRTERSLSNKMLFYIKFAQFFCAVSPKMIVYDDSHDAPFLRVPMVVKNHMEFDEVFGCHGKKRGKFLKQNCTLW